MTMVILVMIKMFVVVMVMMVIMVFVRIIRRIISEEVRAIIVGLGKITSSMFAFADHPS